MRRLTAQIEALLKAEELHTAWVCLSQAPPSDERDAGIALLADGLDGVLRDSIDLNMHRLLRLQDLGGAEDGWWTTFDALPVTHRPTAALDVDPYCGDRPSWADVLTCEADEALWIETAHALGLTVERHPWGDGCFLVDTVAGVGELVFLLRGSRATGDRWERWTLLLN